MRAASKVDSCPQAILKFHFPSSLDYRGYHGLPVLNFVIVFERKAKYGDFIFLFVLFICIEMNLIQFAYRFTDLIYWAMGQNKEVKFTTNTA